MKYTNKLSFWIAIIGLVLGAVYFIWPENDGPSLEVSDSPGSIITVDQIGGTNIIINPELPRPTLSNKIISLNISEGGRYKTEIESTITSVLPIPSSTKLAYPNFCSLQRLGGGPRIFHGGDAAFQLIFLATCFTPSPHNESDILEEFHLN
jgi:hypothetical protein